MNTYFNISLDDFINFILTDKYVTYSGADIQSIQSALRDKLSTVSDPDECEFYSEVVEGLIDEMNEKLKIYSDNNIADAIRSEYELTSNMLDKDISSNIDSKCFYLKIENLNSRSDYMVRFYDVPSTATQLGKVLNDNLKDIAIIRDG